DGASIAAAVFLGALALWFTLVGRRAGVETVADERDAFDLEPSLEQIEARPGNVLVPVRNPHALSHVVAALQGSQASGDRDIVVMTVRLLDTDGTEADASQSAPTPAERRLLSDVVVLAER